MSKYTTEVRYICETAYGLKESKGADSVDEIINGCLDKVFNFNFPMFDESYRKVLESKILKHYYTREIGYETVGLWKLKLNTKLNEIMPYYNKMYESELYTFNPLYTTNLTREHDESGNTKVSGGSDTNGKVDGHTWTESHSDSSADSKDKYSDTPQGGLDGITADTYLTNARLINDTNHSDNNGDVWNDDTNENHVLTHSDGESTNHYLETVVGYEGKNASEMLLKYRQTFINIDMMIINELEELFFQLW